VYDSKTFTFLAGPEEERLLLHQGILARSPVFRAMTELPVKESTERTIQLPDDDSSHFRCLIAFLYESDFLTQSEYDLEARGRKATAPQIQSIHRASRYVPRPPRKTLPIDRNETQTADDSHDTTNHSPLATGTEAVAADLAQIYILGDTYQLPALKRRTLEKMGNLVSSSAEGPVPFLHLVTILNDYTPDSDEPYRDVVRVYSPRALDESNEGSSALAQAIIVGGYMCEVRSCLNTSCVPSSMCRRIPKCHP